MKPWRTISRTAVFDHPPRMRVESHRVELPDGRIIEDWPWIVMPDYVNVVAVTEAGLFIMFRQTKYSVEGITLAPVAGYIEPGENPLSAARRELLEEIGHETDDWTALGSFAVDGNRGCGIGHLYLARDTRQVAEPEADDLEDQDLVALNRAEVEEALRGGEFRVMNWSTSVALALLALDDAQDL
jgi:ADP-ribose pyrophosphatase